MPTKTYTIEPFSEIKFKDFGTLILTQGEAPALTAEADQEVLDHLVVEVRDDTLELGRDSDWLTRIGNAIASLFSPSDQKVNYQLTFTQLEGIHISGQCQLTCDTVTADTLAIQVSGLGKLNFNRIDCQYLDVNISGRAEFTAAGSAAKQHVRISGSGEYQVPHLESQSVRLIISGQGNATLSVSEDLDLTISGFGQVDYYGRPKIHQVISGLGKSQRINRQPSDVEEENNNAEGN